VTHYEVIKLLDGYLAIYIRPYCVVLYYILSRGVALYCTCTGALLSLYMSDYPFILFSPKIQQLYKRTVWVFLLLWHKLIYLWLIIFCVFLGK